MRISITTRAKPDKHKTLPLYVRIAQGGVDRYVSLGLRVPAKDWNPKKQEVRAGSPHAVHFNRLIAGWLSDAQTAALAVVGSGSNPTADRIKDAVALAVAPEPEPVKEVGVEVSAYGTAHVEELFADGKAATAYFKRSVFRSLDLYAPRVTFSEVTQALVRGYVAALKRPKVEGGQGLAPNTVFGRIAVLKALARRAEREGVPGASDAMRALGSVVVKKQKTEKQRLTLADMERLAAMTLTSNPALTKGGGETARDTFVFSFFVGGMRLLDVLTLRWDSVRTEGDPAEVGPEAFVGVSIRQKKTGKISRLPVLSYAQIILARWWEKTGPAAPAPSPFVFGLVTEADFPPPVGLADSRRLRDLTTRRGSLIRAHLYRIQARLGLPRMGFHAARHSFADHMRKSGAGLFVISHSLGHGHLSTTQGYLNDLDDDAVGGAMRDAFTPP